MLRRRTFLAGSSAFFVWGKSGLGRARTQAQPWRPPRVDKRLITRLERPLCGEPALPDLARSWITPVEHFYVLNHGNVPAIDPQHYRLIVDGEVRRPLELSLAELRERFPQREAHATLQCGGNRRFEHHLSRPIDDLLIWRAGAIGNGLWAGAPLRDVLQLAEPTARAKHVCFQGGDRTRFGGGLKPFAGSIPIARVMGQSDTPVLLAHTMNGDPLPENHGFPVRTIVPGYIGARSVKWLRRVTVSGRPSDSPYFRYSHRHGARSNGEPIYEFPINAATCHADRRSGRLFASGYALAAGKAGHRVEAVELSLDGGKRWHQAELAPESHDHCWRLWRAELPIANDERQLIARAVDQLGTLQPRKAPWNVGGYLYNGWSVVAV